MHADAVGLDSASYFAEDAIQITPVTTDSAKSGWDSYTAGLKDETKFLITIIRHHLERDEGIVCSIRNYRRHIDEAVWHLKYGVGPRAI